MPYSSLRDWPESCGERRGGRPARRPRRLRVHLHHRDARHAGARHDHPGAAEADRSASWAATSAKAAQTSRRLRHASGPLMQFLFSPMLGALSDRFGRRPVILLSNLGLGLDYVLMALAPSLAVAVRRPRRSPASRPPASRPPSPTSPTSRRPEKRAAALRHARRRVRPRLHHRPGARRHARRDRPAPAVLGRRRPSASPTRCTACSSCPSRCRPSAARPSRGARQPAGRARAAALASASCSGSPASTSSATSRTQVLPSVFVLYVGYRYGWERRPKSAPAAGGRRRVGHRAGRRSCGPVVARLGERRALLAGPLLPATAGFAIYGLALHRPRSSGSASR